MAKKYTPTRTAREAIETIFSEVNPRNFYSRIERITNEDVEKVETSWGREGRLFFLASCKLRKINLDIKEGRRFLEAVQSLHLLEEPNHSPIFGGLKEFFQRDYTAEEFEIAVNVLNEYLNEKQKQVHKEEMVILLKEAIKRNKERDPKDETPLSRRSWLAKMAQLYLHPLNKRRYHEAKKLSREEYETEKVIEEQYNQTRREYMKIVMKRSR